MNHYEKYADDLAAGRRAALAVASPLDEWPAEPDQSFALPPYWREAAELPADVRTRGTVSRDHLCEMAEQADRGTRSWAEVMVSSFAWGYATAPYGPFRLRRILTEPGNASRLASSLRAAAELAGDDDPIGAYHLLREPPANGGLRLKWYGPAFFTRFLLVAGGFGGHARVLDQVRADAVRRLTGDPELLRGADWPTESYAFYLGFVDGLALHRISPRCG